VDPASSVRAYVEDLHRRARQGDDLTRLDAQLLSSPEPMARMRLVDERRRVVEVRRALEEAFVAAAADWAAAENVRRAAFLAEGVPEALLDRAAVPD
jgi:RNase H-fold protein (predicted Holliday junction resolvase)